MRTLESGSDTNDSPIAKQIVSCFIELLRAFVAALSLDNCLKRKINLIEVSMQHALLWCLAVSWHSLYNIFIVRIRLSTLIV